MSTVWSATEFWAVMEKVTGNELVASDDSFEPVSQLGWDSLTVVQVALALEALGLGHLATRLSVASSKDDIYREYRMRADQGEVNHDELMSALSQ